MLFTQYLIRTTHYLIICVLLFIMKNTHAQDPQFRHYTVNDGLSHSTVYHVMQDSKGYVWFCTESGVNRFDGKRFETFTIADGLADNENFKCYEDSKGRIWFLSYNGKLSYFKDTVFINEQKDPTLKYQSAQGKYIVDMMEDKDGNIWFSCFLDPPYVYNGDTILRYKYDSNSNSCFLLFQYKNEISALYFADIGSGDSLNVVYKLDLINKKKEIISSNKDRDALSNVVKQYVNKDEFYFSNGTGLIHYKNGIFKKYVLTGKEMGHNIGTPLLEKNNLWICNPSGLILIPDFATKGFTGYKKKFLQGISTTYLMLDKEGGMWITTQSDGIYYIPASQAYVKNFSDNSILSIDHQQQSDLWAIGTFYGKLIIYSGDKIIDRYRIAYPDSYYTDDIIRVKGIKWISNEELIIGTDHTPFIYNITNRKMTPFVVLPLGDSVSKGGIGYSDMAEGANGLWITGRYGVFLWDKINKPFELIMDTSVSLWHLLPRLVSIANGGKNRAWVASLQNLYRFDFLTCKLTDIAGRNIFQSNLRDLQYINGYLWVATDGNGIFIFKDGKFFKHISSKNAMITSNICRKLVYDGKENMWVATNKGISVYNVNNYNYVMGFSTNDVLPSDDVKDISLYGGKAYVATPSGATVIDVEKFIFKVSPPKIYIKNLTAEGKTYNHLVSPKFYYHNGIISLSYTAITFQVNHALKYRYRIKGEDEKWNVTNTDRIEFFNLNPGTYTVQVEARKYNSSWSIPAEYTFTVLPLWYQSLWFKILVAAIAAGIVYFWIYRIRKREEEKTVYNKRIAELKNNALASQMNPHFIFNTLNSLQTFVLQNKPLEANHYIARFSRLIRSIMNYSSTQDISLEKELEFLSLYIELEQLRFEERFDTIIKVDEELSPIITYIPSLVIQPFIENAIKYGLSGKKEKGLLEIIFKKQDDFILVTINDNGVGRKKIAMQQAASPKEFESKGIKYTEERLLLISGNRTDKKMVNITDLYNGDIPIGTRVELIIPILND